MFQHFDVTYKNFQPDQAVQARVGQVMWSLCELFPVDSRIQATFKTRSKQYTGNIRMSSGSHSILIQAKDVNLTLVLEDLRRQAMDYLKLWRSSRFENEKRNQDNCDWIKGEMPMNQKSCG
jgi:hypothetical protein